MRRTRGEQRPPKGFRIELRVELVWPSRWWLGMKGHLNYVTPYPRGPGSPWWVTAEEWVSRTRWDGSGPRGDRVFARIDYPHFTKAHVAFQVPEQGI